MTVTAIGAFSRIVNGMRDAVRGLERSAPRDPGRIDARPPKSLVTWKDPAGRFELWYPSSWRLTNVGGVMARSASIGSFARVDVVESPTGLWGDVVRALEAAGAMVQLRHRPTETRLHGEVDLDSVHFRWDAYAHPVQGGVAVLSLGNVVDAKRGRTLERYEDVMLATIRRHFTARRRA